MMIDLLIRRDHSLASISIRVFGQFLRQSQAPENNFEKRETDAEFKVR